MTDTKTIEVDGFLLTFDPEEIKVAVGSGTIRFIACRQKALDDSKA